jgi:hypothetical protein
MKGEGMSFQYFPTEEGASGERILTTGEMILYKLMELRRERTGMHGSVAIFVARTEDDNKLLASDTFNIGRNEERGRLAKSAHGSLPEAIRDFFPVTEMKHDLDIICEWARNKWEEERFTIEEVDPADEAPDLVYVLEPYIIQRYGTILVAPQGSGKSYICQLMACSISMGITDLWDVTRRPTLYINLERDRDSFSRREASIRKCLNINGPTGVRYLHGRGYGLRSVSRVAKRFIREEPDGVIFFDSISRGGLGTLVDDQTANVFTDTMNWIGGTWVGIGHTAWNGDHVYGSVHFEAGCDIAVKVSKEEKDQELGLGLTIVKANDLPKGRTKYLALEFDQDNLSGVRVPQATEFLDLLLDQGLSREQKIEQYLSEVDCSYAGEISDSIDVARSHVTAILRTSKKFQRVKKENRRDFYGLAAQTGD